MLAKITFIGDFKLRVPVTGAVRACGDTVAATDTGFRVYHHQTVFLFIGGPYRAGGNTRRRIALHTLPGLKLGSFAG
jgi:hypothetical protein